MKNLIQGYFNAAASRRDEVMAQRPVAAYEQRRRQQAVLELLDLHPNDHVLDVGCGNARDLVVMATNGGRCIGVDFSVGMLINGKSKLQGQQASLAQADATRLPFADATFDKVSCSEVVEHIPNWDAAVSEISRTVKPGGRVVITTPNRRGLYWGSRELAAGLRWLKRTSGTAHPYDEWKTHREVIDALEAADIRADKMVGACYLPGILPQYLPMGIQRLLIKIVSWMENHLRWRAPGLGYMICVSGIKDSCREKVGDLDEVSRK